ncbi:MAG: carboxypeptidase regulatory-like domain-containing protein [Thermoplasmata archaeon]
MQSSHSGWWHRNGWTVAILLSAFAAAFAVRTIWTYPIVQQFGPLFSYAGGSDSYYHSRVTTYIILNHRNLVFDPLLHYPVGGYNPREPLFDWMNAILGMVFAPAFGGNAVVAGAWFLDLQGPLWAALGVFPVYLIGREVSGKRTGLIAAVIFPFLSANIDSSIFGYANYLSFYTFVILITVYSYIRTVKAVGNRRWVEDYKKPSQYLPALRAFLRTERTAVKWAVFTGVSLGALALAWQGYTYAIVVIGISLLIIMLVERIRRIDSFGLYVTTWIVGLIGFPMAFPYYIVQHQFSAWFDLPLLLFFGILALLLPFLLLRDVPWVFSIPLLVLIVLGAAVFLFAFEPTYFTDIVTGQGYFSKTLIYSTVAEAQSPSIDELVVGYGVVTFFLAFAGLAIFIFLLVRGRFKRHHVVFLVFAVLSIYLPISAAKFFLLGSPAFALLPAEAIRRALDVGGYPELRRTVASLSDRRSQAAAFRKAFKPRHVLVLLLVLVVVLPNVWISIDAGIPGNTKTGLSEQVYDTLPAFLKGNASTDTNYFGAAGTTIDTSNQYDSAGYNWLATQDVNTPQPQRPAVVSWWDYGFQTIDQGQHPSVADNFQNGIDPAGQFLLAQNESNAIALLTTTLLQAEQLKTGESYLPSSLNAVLAGDGLNLTQLHNYLVNQTYDFQLVVNNPDRYLPVDPSTLTDANAMYMAMSYYLATSTTLSGISHLYNDVQAYTGWSVRYDLADSRLIPFSGQDTGIYYAPADLTGRVIDAAGLPSTYFNVTVEGSDGNTYPLGSVPADVSAIQYLINYFSPFYNSMIYRTYFGYNGTDIGLSGGIPGLEGAAASEPIEPGWMLQHFQVVYKTAYYCPSAAEAAANPSCYVAMNEPAAVSLANRTNGSADTTANMYFSGGESMLEYYPGQTLLGDVQLPNGAPDPGVRVTVFDQWGIPHMTAVTAPDGSFSLVLPPGNDTLNLTVGSLQGLSQQGSTVLKSIPITVSNAVGLSLVAPSLQQTFTLPAGSVSGFVYWDAGNTSTYTPPADALVSGAKVVLWGPNNTTRITATTDASGAIDLTNVPPGIYNYSILVDGTNYTETPLSVAPAPAGPTNATVGLETGVVSGYVFSPVGGFADGALVTLADPSGPVQTNTTNSTGFFFISSYTPGNYSLTATVPGTTERSPAVLVSVPDPGSGLTTNLTMAYTAPVTVTVSANGVPVGGIPVQFLPIRPYGNVTTSPITTLSAAAGNGTSALSGSNGLVTLSLPVGQYSVTATGFVGSTLYAGLGSLTVASAGAPARVALSLGPAIRLSGSVSTSAASGTSVVTSVVAFSAAGNPAYTWTVNGSYSFYLPAGTYTVLAIQGAGTGYKTLSVALASVPLTYPTVANLQPTTAIEARFTVGSLLSNGTLFPATGARVNISAGIGGPTVGTTAGVDGGVVAYLPSALPLYASSYCVGATAAGYASASACNISPNGLGSMLQFPLTLRTVPVTVRLLGGPSGSNATVNVTAVSPTAVSHTLKGGPTWSVALLPGSYALSGWAPTGTASVVYRPAGPLNVSVAFGSTGATYTLTVLSQTNSTGTVTLPSGGLLANATVTLSSASFNTTVPGKNYTSVGFFAPPGTYSAYATDAVGTSTYVALQSVSISTAGKVTPSLSITNPGYRLQGTIESESGVALPVNISVALTAPSGTTALLAATHGSFAATLPGATTYTVAATASTVASGPAGTYDISWVAIPGSTCSVVNTTTPCAVRMVPTAQLVWLNGTLSAPGVPGLVSGTVRLAGPSPNQNLTVTPAANGTFSTRVLPGTYSLYASGGGGSEPLAGFTTVGASLSAPASVAVVLSPTWSDTVTVLAPSGGSPLLGPVNVTVTSAFGVAALYTNVTPSVPFSVALPVGTYTVGATSFGAPYGLPAQASNASSVRVVSGNVGTTVSLVYQYTYRASVSVAGTGTATVTSPGTAIFSFSVRNSGNAPIRVHPVGSPAYWGFNFTFANVTLTAGSGGGTLSAAVAIQVPPNTATNHPSVIIDLDLPNGTVVGSFSPTVNIVAVYGIAVGPATGTPAQVGVSSALVPFYVTNTGNTPVSVSLSVVDSPRVTSLGWNVAFRSSTGPVTTPTVTLNPFENATYYVNLTTTQTIFVPVGSLTVQASVVNSSGSYQASTDLRVPTASVRPGTTNGTAAVTVTGPSVGAAPHNLPDWVVPLLSFVPAIALVVGVITYRWWRTRRWTRR